MYLLIHPHVYTSQIMNYFQFRYLSKNVNNSLLMTHPFHHHLLVLWFLLATVYCHCEKTSQNFYWNSLASHLFLSWFYQYQMVMIYLEYTTGRNNMLKDYFNHTIFTKSFLFVVINNRIQDSLVVLGTTILNIQ